MRELRARAASVHEQRMQELAYLANVLAAGCSLEGRTLRPLESAHAAVAACNLGIEHLLQVASARTTAVAVLERQSADKVFRIGWRLLSEDVVLPAARALEKWLTDQARAENHRGRAQPLDLASRTLHSALTAGKPWLALGKLANLEVDIEMTTLLALIDECPSLCGTLASGSGAKGTVAGPRFIATHQQVRAVQAFLAGL
jgi:hypothetical protein